MQMFGKGRKKIILLKKTDSYDCIIGREKNIAEKIILNIM